MQKTSHNIENNIERAFHQQEGHHRETMTLAWTREQQECHQIFKTSIYEQHKNINPDRVDGTCQWILGNPQYLAWQNSAQNDLLWISADPGCGKSVLAKSLIDKDLKACTSATICYFFFKDNDEQNNNAAALCAVLHQLFSIQPYLLRHALQPWKRNGVKIQQEVEELWRILIASISDPEFTNTVCIFDALDECRPSDQVPLIRKLEKFYTKDAQRRSLGQQHWLKFLVTSRPYNDILEGFRPVTQLFPLIHICGEEENEQIHDEISLVVKMRVAELGKSLQLASETRERLEQQLLQMEHRTYLWLYLAMDDIRAQFESSLRPKEELIQLIPSSVTAAYTKILHQVPSGKVSDVKMILRIIIGARRPLTIDEMAMALGHVKSSSSQIVSTYGLNPKGLDAKIRHLCGLFVFVSNSRVYLIHQTATEFLLSHGQDWSLEKAGTETLLSNICINYLLFEDIDGMLEQGNSSAPYFLEYSAENWADHVREMPIEAVQGAEPRITRLYDVTSARFALWYPIFWQAVGGHRPNMSSLRLAAFNGHKDVLQRLVRGNEVSIDKSDECGATALYWASYRGHLEIVQILLDKGANVNAEGGLLGNALAAAAAEGHFAIVQLLLYNGANINTKDSIRVDALFIALMNGHIRIAQLLLDNGADANSEDSHYGHALQVASQYGYLEIVQLLLDNGADVNAGGGLYGNALQAAVFSGHLEIVQLLLDNGADANAQGSVYGNALQAASFGGHREIAQLLLDDFANVNAEGGVSSNALQAASYSGHLEIVQLLLHLGADSNAQRGDFGNALHSASMRGHLRIVQLLLGNGANVNSQGGDFGNALQAASVNGHLGIVQLLLDNGANVNAQGGKYGNALHAATENGHLELAQLLTRRGARLQAKEENCW